MARTVEPIANLSIDGENFVVAELSPTVQNMVEIFNGWNQKESDVADELMMIKAAKADMSRQIILQVRQDKEAAAAAETPVEAAAEPTTEE